MTMEEAGERCWSDLPSDILNLIKTRLFGTDLSFFHVVCRAWQSVPSKVPSPVQLTQPSITFSAMIQSPMLMFSGRDHSMCNFYHPIYNTTYIMEVPEIASATIRYSKDGWLLLSQGKHAMFFFNPFTKERIDLPDLRFKYRFKVIAFSSLPTLADCIVFGIVSDLPEKTCFNFIRHGESTWHECIVENILMFQPFYGNPVFYDGVFYCLGEDGNLGIFDPKQEDECAWTVLARPKQPCVSIRRNYLAECNGELVSVFECQVQKLLEVFRLDRSVMAWKKLSTIENNMLFLSATTSFSVTSAAMEVLGMGNKIYLPRFSSNNCVFYSLVSGKFHSFGIGYCNENCYNTTEKKHCTWIQPSFKVHTNEELHWNRRPIDY